MLVLLYMKRLHDSLLLQISSYVYRWQPVVQGAVVTDLERLESPGSVNE